MFYLYFIAIFLQVFNGIVISSKWNLHQCKDNDEIPVDWWYIYKPSDDFLAGAGGGRGLNFTYITPRSRGRWQPSETFITSRSMLHHTVTPIYKPSLHSKLAYAIYEESDTSSALGILMATEKGGIWITHTVPGLPSVDRFRHIFPVTEARNGHLIMCMSVDLMTINYLASVIKLASPKFVKVHVPKALNDKLSDWNTLMEPVDFYKLNKPTSLEFISIMKLLRVVTMVRQPGEKYCLYRSFARQKKIVLDVYGQTYGEYMMSACGDQYSVRNIDQISLKIPDYIYYVKKDEDLSKFAVNTAAHWQKRGTGPEQYWVCNTNLDKDDYTAKGAVLLCVENYEIWQSFQNLIVKEPEC